MIEPTDQPACRPELQVDLHHATRTEHASLNRAIVARLPLCLSPNVSSPFAYAAGMVVFSHIYTALEESWNSLLQEDNQNRLEPRHRELLIALKTECMPRTQKLRHDLENLKRSLGPAMTRALEALHTKTQHFYWTVYDSIQSKPHITLAYSWTMYLALFNGGRWIVNQLIDLDASYWFDEQHSAAVTEKYLSFWFFDDTPRDQHHGEIVKIDFKRNFNTAARDLNDAERSDVILESKALFRICADMVTLLDEEMAQINSLKRLNQTKEVSTDSTLSSCLLTALPVNSMWQSLRAVIGYTILRYPTPANETPRA